MITRDELTKLVKSANGNNRSRLCGNKEIKTFLDLLQEHENNPNTWAIRVYSSEGFCSNSYKYKAQITYISATRTDSGEWIVAARRADAKRPYGRGPQTTINNR